MTVDELKEYVTERFDALESNQHELVNACKSCTRMVDINDDKLKVHLTEHAAAKQGNTSLWIGVTVATIAAMIALLKEVLSKSVGK